MVRAAVVRAAVLVAATVVAGGCSNGSDEAEQRTTVPTAPAVTSTTNPYAVPEVIDAAYVNRVLAGLDAAVGDVVRMVVAAGHVTPESLDRLKTLYQGEAFSQRVNSFTADSAEGFSDYKPNPGNRRTTVSELITARPRCIFTRVIRDFSAVGTSPDAELSDQYVGLEPLDPRDDPNGHNPTNWIMIYDGFVRSRSRPPNPCESAS